MNIYQKIEKEHDKNFYIHQEQRWFNIKNSYNNEKQI